MRGSTWSLTPQGPEPGPEAGGPRRAPCCWTRALGRSSVWAPWAAAVAAEPGLSPVTSGPSGPGGRRCLGSRSGISYTSCRATLALTQENEGARQLTPATRIPLQEAPLWRTSATKGRESKYLSLP